MRIYAGSSSSDLAQKVASELGIELGLVELSKFPNGEKRVIIKDRKVGKRAILLQSLSTPVDEMIVEMALIVDALVRMGVEDLIGVVPWLGYAKQDKVFQSGEPLSAQVVARILDTCGFSKIVTVDLHDSGIVKLFETRIVELSARNVLAEYFREELGENVIVVAPDKGAVESATLLADELNVGVVRVEKTRDLVTGDVRVLEVSGGVKGKNVIILDDNIVTGETLIKVSQELVGMGARSVRVGLTHHMYVQGVQKKIDGCEAIGELVVTDTVQSPSFSVSSVGKKVREKLKILSVAGLIAGEL